ncbi:MAG: hypothetical protein ACI9V1_000677 [Spirosomataceae bacterium]|jgi:hypothetical protein
MKRLFVFLGKSMKRRADGTFYYFAITCFAIKYSSEGASYFTKNNDR